MSARPYLSSRLREVGTSIFAEMTQLAVQHQAVNLGQGFPDFDGPDFVKEAAVAAIRSGNNQYCRTSGLPELVRAIAAHQRRFYGLEYDPETEVTVYAGATEGICATLQGLLEAGDEVILFEPFYDAYPAALAMAGAGARGGKPRGGRVPHHPPGPAGPRGPPPPALLPDLPHNTPPHVLPP